jgi:hypothetical protein
VTHQFLNLNTFYFSGVKNDPTKRESQRLIEADEYYADNYSEDESMRVIRKRKNQQQSLRQEITSMPSSGGSMEGEKL